MRSENFWAWFDDCRKKLGAREKSFTAMFEHLDQFDRPVRIVETGCIEGPPDDESWAGNGCSTVLFEKYIETHSGSTAVSIELILDKVLTARQICPQVSVVCGDSAKVMEMLADHGDTVDLLYLDASHLYWNNPATAAGHHLNELMAALPMIREDTLVAVDDSPAVIDDDNLTAEIGGKGWYIGHYARSVGARRIFTGYQVGWLGMTGKASHADFDVAAVTDKARAAVEADDVIAASEFYRNIIVNTSPPRTGQQRVARGEACAFFAKMSVLKGRLGTAADWYRRAIDADPRGADYRLDLIKDCFLPIGHLKAALTEAERAARIEPDYHRVWKILGGVWHELNEAEKCIEAYDKALALNPGDPDAVLDRCVIALDTSDFDRVRDLCDLAMGTSREADAVHCLAMAAYRQHRHEEAIELYQTAIDLKCNDAAHAHWNMSLAMHSIGMYRQGWIEHEYREKTKANPALYLPMRRFNLPRWKGEGPNEIPEPSKHVPGRTEGPALIHVHYEAGSGDNLACVRYLNVLRDRGFRVRYETSDDMLDLMRSSFPDIEIVAKAPDYPGALGIEPFDYHTPIGSLPALLGTDIDTVPWSGPYLKADPALIERYRSRLAKFAAKKRIGFCWSSGIRDGIWMQEYGLRKSMHLEALIPILDDINLKMDDMITAVSLQVGPERLQIQDCDLPTGWIQDILPAKPTWAETAALVASLDLVITVDTAVAHLAGGMGKPTWLMCQRDACSWHFMCWRPGAPWNEASPWYPSMRVFRQREFDQPHFWDDVISDIAAELRNWSCDNQAAAAE